MSTGTRVVHRQPIPHHGGQQLTERFIITDDDESAMNLDDPSKPKIPRSPSRRRVSCVRQEGPAGPVVATARLEVHWVAAEAEVEAIS